jgi:hypothetical protein
VTALALLLAGSVAGADKPAPRFETTPDLKSYPQGTPKEALASVLKAVQAKQYDYLLAQLSDPKWVDGRAAVLEGGFAALMQETKQKLDAPALKSLGRYLDKGEVETKDARSVISLKDHPGRVVRLRKLDGRWYLQNDSRP